MTDFKALHEDLTTDMKIGSPSELGLWLLKNRLFILSALETAQQVEEQNEEHHTEILLRDAALAIWQDQGAAYEAENASLKAQLETARAWRKCQTHGHIDGARQWGCPDCVAELRGKTKTLQVQLAECEQVKQWSMSQQGRDAQRIVALEMQLEAQGIIILELKAQLAAKERELAEMRRDQRLMHGGQ